MTHGDTGVFTLHLVELPRTTTASLLVRPPGPGTVPGLRHAETLALMRLGAPVVSPDRLQLRRLAMFARWDDEAAIDDHLASPAGARLADGWHVRMRYLRRWSQISALPGLPARAGEWDEDEPVVAVTVARMRLPEVPRFLHWGRPVERQVRDDPGATLAGAAMRPPNTIATFSIWRTVRAMTDMVHGHSDLPDPHRHEVAMEERRRRDFHHEFATYRFRPVSEHGSWDGRRGYVPGLPPGA
ncbi:hypothetical protein [Tsukamurella pseudospumae]|uniref:Spheroidene monooxygenase n=1 Tax=Tsukamurella pseudospumae TaxID=239498 RepID=A0A138A3Y0_9ACTN|nr:hypothetical protein [Tsukamurella pseudospumae]KXO96282.1 hypothetical protein AXK61_22455 [Tsukamurella pseudospumae]KXP05134.1 hypothetical protein AXK60_13340 [Tsukamurella pseudospumae]